MFSPLIMGFMISRLSCVAAENNIFVAANYASVVEGKVIDLNHFQKHFTGCDYCEDGEECYFNTLVVFNNLGAIVAVYHKFNLWTSELTHFNIDKSPQVQKSIN